ncbi:peptidoglycan D,D-transpeptidase FtsI family protein [Azotosporobacter soli]|uniref:peptidoglycan D,D-transpeptidase FtsI family protein n=1 Tax=Azotosporobacter soli TaxID=3055040 RepID=UPI0031FF1201
MMLRPLDDMRGFIRKTAYVLLAAMVSLLAYLTYIQLYSAKDLAENSLNRRNMAAAQKIKPGLIFDRNGEVLADSRKTKDGFQRQYPYGAIMAPVIGYSSLQRGSTGLESAWAQQLLGLDNPLSQLGPVGTLWQTGAGNNLVLNIDAALQQAAYEALGSRKGAVVAFNPKTGAILALVSRPSFSPASLDDNWTAVSNDPNSPLLNRATQGLYPPGSIIKVLVAEAALREKKADLNTLFECSGDLFIPPDYHLTEDKKRAHGKINLAEALTVSCNVTFGTLALELGGRTMQETFRRYGFEKELGAGFSTERSHLPDFTALGRGDLAQTGIGQGELLVTPLRMAMLAGVFANDGVMMLPRLVNRIETADGQILRSFAPEIWLKPVESEQARQIRKMMVQVVEEGTGASARFGGVKVAGKTGTAENAQGQPHAWFIGFAPADNPQIAIAVIVENGGGGGSVAAPIARRIMSMAIQ